jgi:hypothetical protein
MYPELNEATLPNESQQAIAIPSDVVDKCNA